MVAAEQRHLCLSRPEAHGTAMDAKECSKTGSGTAASNAACASFESTPRRERASVRGRKFAWGEAQSTRAKSAPDRHPRRMRCHRPRGNATMRRECACESHRRRTMVMAQRIKRRQPRQRRARQWLSLPLNSSSHSLKVNLGARRPSRAVHLCHNAVIAQN